MLKGRRSRPAWDAYLRQFHQDRPGITEAVLARSRRHGQTPYQWLAEGMGDHPEVVIDLGCGSAPTRRPAGRGWIGLDTNLAELAGAGPDAIGHVVQADLTRLPFRRGACHIAVCSMALMLVDPLDEALREIRRTLQPGGVLRLLLPTRTPLTMHDRARYAGLAASLGTLVLFPTSPLLRDPVKALHAAGFAVVAEDSGRFAYPIRSPEDAVLLVDSLYLPSVSPRRRRGAQRLVARWATSDVGIPLRRVIATSLPLATE